MTRSAAVRAGAALLALAAVAGCARSDASAVAETDGATSASSAPADRLRLGYFANVTHAGAVYGVGSGVFAKALGRTKLTTQVFNAGPVAVEALFAGSLDAAFVGPNPAVNAFVRSRGAAIRIVAGATSGGASLVVRPSISGPADLRGTTLASPQTGGTQDIALRQYLAEHGIRTDLRGAGDATILAQENSQTLSLFRAGRIDGAWVPEPWASRLLLEGGGKVLVDERELWPGGRFVTTHLVVRTDYLRKHPGTVQAFLRGLIEANRAIDADRVSGTRVINAELERLTGKALDAPTIDRALAQITLTVDPIASSLRTSAEHAFATGLVKRADLRGIYDLTLLRELLGTPVDDAGLGRAAG